MEGSELDSERKGEAEHGPSIDAIRSQAVRAVGLLGVREVLARGIGFLGTVGLSWVFLPRDMSFLATTAGILGFATFLTGTGLGGALVRQREEPNKSEYDTLFTLQLSLGIVVGGIVWIASFFLGRLWNLHGLDWFWIGLTSVSLPISAFGAPARVRLERKLSYRRIATADIASQFTNYAVMLLIALAGYPKEGVAFGIVLSAAASSGTMLVRSKSVPSLGVSRSELRRIFGFGIAMQAQGFVAMIRDSVTPLGLRSIAGAFITGEWGWSQRLTMIELAVLNVIWRVSFPALSRLPDSPQLQRSIAERMIAVVAFFTCLIGGLVVGIGQPLLNFVFSPRWQSAYPALYVMLVTLSVSGAVSNGLSAVIFAQGRPHLLAWNQVFQTVAFWTVGLLLLPRIGFLGIGIASGVANVTDALQLYFACRPESRPPVVRTLLPPILMELGLIAIIRLALNGAGWLRLAGFAAIVPWLVVVWLSQRSTIESIMKLVHSGFRNLGHLPSKDASGPAS